MVFFGNTELIGDGVGEKAREAFFAAANSDLLRVVLKTPLNGNSKLREHLVECAQVAINFGIGQHSVAVKNEGRHGVTRPFR